MVGTLAASDGETVQSVTGCGAGMQDTHSCTRIEILLTDKSPDCNVKFKPKLGGHLQGLRRLRKGEEGSEQDRDVLETLIPSRSPPGALARTKRNQTEPPEPNPIPPVCQCRGRTHSGTQL